MRGILLAFCLGHEQEVTEETEKTVIKELCYLCSLLLNFLFNNEFG